MKEKSRAGRRAWGYRVIAELIDEVGLLRGKTIEIHAGRSYVDPLEDLLLAEGARVVTPLAHIPFGSRLAWYAAANAGLAASPEVSTRGDETAEVLSALTTAQAMTPCEILSSPRERWSQPGLYCWWVDADGAADLASGLGSPVEAGLIYAGLAGAARSRSGKKSTNTLWGRLTIMHLGGNHEFSTFRRSLGSTLVGPLGWDGIDELALTRWMHQHLSLTAVPFPDADRLGLIEEDVLRALNPPLNLRDVPRPTSDTAFCNSVASTGDDAELMSAPLRLPSTLKILE